MVCLLILPGEETPRFLFTICEESSSMKLVCFFLMYWTLLKGSSSSYDCKISYVYGKE